MDRGLIRRMSVWLTTRNSLRLTFLLDSPPRLLEVMPGTNEMMNDPRDLIRGLLM